MALRIAFVGNDRTHAEACLNVLTCEMEWIADPANPDVVVVDAAHVDAIARCAQWAASGHRVVLTNVDEHDDTALDALDAGARGVVYALAPSGDLARAVRTVHAGEIWAPRRVIADAWTRLRAASATRGAGEAALAQRLSSREREVFRYAAAGMGNRELANRLAISEATVKVHLTHIFQKLGVRGRTELAAAFHGILRQPATPGGSLRTTTIG